MSGRSRPGRRTVLRRRAILLRGLATLGLAATAVPLVGCGGGGNTASSASAGGAGPGATAYTVGGTVTGLTGSGLTLQVNGAGTLPIAANATGFTFASGFTTGQTYTVSVSAQPSSPSETCTLKNASGTIGSASVANVAVSCTAVSPNNVATITLDSFNKNSGGNTAYVSVRICAPGSASNCQTIDHITVDTGSFGLRILSSAITNAGLLAALPNVNGSTGPFLAECQQFGSGYTWGSVRSVDFSIPGTAESVSSLPAQIIGDLEPAPKACSTQAAVSGQMLGNTGYLTPAAFGANGLIGVGPFPQDCGACASVAQPTSNGVSYFVYTNCSGTTSSTCSTAGTRVPLAKQVINPVSDFSVDNNGVIITLPAVSAAGVPSLSGTMTFGIATSAGNNGLGNATVYLADPSTAYVTTVYKNVTDTRSFIDSGSNGLYFNDSSLTACTGMAKGFYCPGGSTSPYNNGPQSIAETGVTTFEDYQGQHPTPIDFTVENAYVANVVSSGLAGTGSANEFDWGMPFFFGRTVYTAMGIKNDGFTPIVISGNPGPFYAF